MGSGSWGSVFLEGSLWAEGSDYHGGRPGRKCRKRGVGSELKKTRARGPGHLTSFWLLGGTRSPLFSLQATGEFGKGLTFITCSPLVWCPRTRRPGIPPWSWGESRQDCGGGRSPSPVDGRWASGSSLLGGHTLPSGLTGGVPHKREIRLWGSGGVHNRGWATRV